MDFLGITPEYVSKFFAHINSRHDTYLHKGIATMLEGNAGLFSSAGGEYALEITNDNRISLDIGNDLAAISELPRLSKTTTLSEMAFAEWHHMCRAIALVISQEKPLEPRKGFGEREYMTVLEAVCILAHVWKLNPATALYKLVSRHMDSLNHIHIHYGMSPWQMLEPYNNVLHHKIECLKHFALDENAIGVSCELSPHGELQKHAKAIIYYSATVAIKAFDMNGGHIRRDVVNLLVELEALNAKAATTPIKGSVQETWYLFKIWQNAYNMQAGKEDADRPFEVVPYDEFEAVFRKYLYDHRKLFTFAEVAELTYKHASFAKWVRNVVELPRQTQPIVQYLEVDGNRYAFPFAKKALDVIQSLCQVEWVYRDDTNEYRLSYASEEHHDFFMHGKFYWDLLRHIAHKMSLDGPEHHTICFAYMLQTMVGQTTSDDWDSIINTPEGEEDNDDCFEAYQSIVECATKYVGLAMLNFGLDLWEGDLVKDHTLVDSLGAFAADKFENELFPIVKDLFDQVFREVEDMDGCYY